MVADIVKNSLHLEDDPTFDPTRKGILDPKTLPFEERAALIKENPAYGQIICRCESVTEGEIIDAIHRVPGARSLDGIKPVSYTHLDVYKRQPPGLAAQQQRADDGRTNHNDCLLYTSRCV